MLHSSLKLEDGQIYLSMKEYVVFCQVHIGNEFHLLFVCKHSQITALRNKYVPSYYTVDPSEMIGMLSYCNVMLYRNLCYFIKTIMGVLDVM